MSQQAIEDVHRAHRTQRRARESMQTMSGRLIDDLGDGLVVRHATPADADELCQFNGAQHADPGQSFDHGVATWTCDMIERPPRGCTLDDFTVVEDTRT